jgi:phospholipid/cholesterol/gamma-HCH transport system permease protein
VKKLVVPRVGALVIALPLLTILADVMGLFGGLVMAITDIGQGRAYFINHILLALRSRTSSAGSARRSSSPSSSASSPATTD